MIDNAGKPRERTPDKTGALTLHQGRSSAATGGTKADKDLVVKGTITLQIHRVNVQDGPAREIRGLALYVPREHDAVAGGNGG
ncbi:MAG: hypothetical protein IPQ09_22940 [Myxococcales bacterium]|nr:hypothetical protein [Myxococcales bacterium]